MHKGKVTIWKQSDFESNSPNNCEMIVPVALTLPAVYVDPSAESMHRMRKTPWSVSVEISCACLLKEKISFSFTL